MNHQSFPIEILTPFGQYLKTDIEFLSVQTSDYLLGILPNHAPLIATLKISKMVIKNKGLEEVFAIGGGVLHIQEEGHVLLMLNSIESKDEIDVNRALAAKERAEKKIQEKQSLESVVRAEAALKRALNRLNVANSLK